MNLSIGTFLKESLNYFHLDLAVVFQILLAEIITEKTRKNGKISKGFEQ